MKVNAKLNMILFNSNNGLSKKYMKYGAQNQGLSY